MWDLPGPGIKPVSPALVGGFLSTEPPGKPSMCSLHLVCYQRGDTASLDPATMPHDSLGSEPQMYQSSALQKSWLLLLRWARPWCWRAWDAKMNTGHPSREGSAREFKQLDPTKESQTATDTSPKKTDRWQRSMWQKCPTSHVIRKRTDSNSETPAHAH